MSAEGLVIGGRRVAVDEPTYFVADIAANHDGDLGRAVALVGLAAEAGADAAKFQHFTASTIVSDAGFRGLGRQGSHQSGWEKSVFEVYEDASVDLGWTSELRRACHAAGLAFMTTPYSLELVDALAPSVDALKIGSGDITWTELIAAVAGKGKPVMLATGAASLDEVRTAMAVLLRATPEVVLMQCNTNYLGTAENLAFVNLRVLQTYRQMFPDVVPGLSDHTPGHSAVLGAVALGARVVEKHFTDDPGRAGPDHAFSMSPAAWREMVSRTRELEMALGSPLKQVEDNERETVVLQRRCVRARTPLPAGTVLTRDMLVVLRPCPEGMLPPSALTQVIGRTLTRDLEQEEAVQWSHFA